MIKFSVKAILLTFGTIVALSLASCIQNNTPQTAAEPSYTIWTKKIPYSDFKPELSGDLANNHFVRKDFMDAEWTTKPKALDDGEKRTVTKAQLQILLLDLNFSRTLAKELSCWLISIDHGYIVARSGDMVDCIWR